MTHVSLYRRFRPATFDTVIGQNHITRTLTNQIKSGNIGHAYLFTGTRGTGKTSCAKIFARAVNCLQPQNGSPCGKCAVCKTLAEQNYIDILEIDAASNNGVEEIRTLKENVYYRPTVGKYKVYIIDEVHMLSSSAFNALLKTLEEPPEHVVFILATTEVHKIPQTILSRCLRFDFRLVEEEELVALLQRIFDETGVEYELPALHRIAVSGEGSVRDTLSVADMCMSYCGGKINQKDVLEILCATDFSDLDSLGNAILEGNCSEALRLTDSLLKHGRTTVYKDLAKYFFDLVAIKNIPGYRPSTLSETEWKTMQGRCNHSNYRISRVTDIMTELENKMRFSSQPRILLESAVVRACSLVTDLNLDALTNRVTELENKLKELSENGMPFPPAPPPRQVREEEVIKPKVDLSSLLSEVATKEEGEVFDDGGVSGVDEEAVDAWARIVTFLQETGERTLFYATKDIKNKDISISGKDFIVLTEDNATQELFSREDHHKLLQSLIQKELGDEYRFNARPKTAKVAISEKDKMTLDRLFNGSIKYKK